jgi:hypothetical protein
MILYSPQAEEDLAKLAPHLLNAVEHQLGNLEQHPATLGRPSVSPPYPPDLLLYQFWVHDPGGARHFFTILYRRGTNENDIHVIGVGHQVF